MPRAFALILLAVLLAVGAFTACFFTAARVRHAAANTGHELDWLRAEFRLSDAELARVRALHEGYLPKCEEMCQRIAAQNGELAQLLDGSTNVSPANTGMCRSAHGIGRDSKASKGRKARPAPRRRCSSPGSAKERPRGSLRTV